MKCGLFDYEDIKGSWDIGSMSDNELTPSLDVRYLLFFKRYKLRYITTPRHMFVAILTQNGNSNVL